ncbi:tyrosine-protein phosphatase [Rhodococcus sp. NPDC003318]|uniref:tyrosine-protein phosphatase n=1 Tax=Rhodococcus sp. NPDC003318 TaxID=3364503 RepID=UPI0036B68BAF
MTRTRSRLLRTAGTVAAAALFVGGTSSVAALAPAAVAVAVADQLDFDRSLHLDGARNARDVGGYTTTEGKTVRTGLVYRTDTLNNLSGGDLTKLESLDVTVVDDLRTVYERSIQPDRIPSGATANWYDVLGGSSPTTLVDLNSAYVAFIDGPGASEAFASVLRDIRDSDGAVLYHCSAGKDRTGWTTAVLLTILGVDRATVNADFMLSNDYRGTDGVTGTGSIDGVQQGWLDTAFATAEQRHGSFDAYVRDGLGLTDADITVLKTKLLQ